MRCKKCGSRIFLVDETITHLEINGEIVKELGSGDLHNRNCLRCTEPLYLCTRKSLPHPIRPLISADQNSSKPNSRVKGGDNDEIRMRRVKAVSKRNFRDLPQHEGLWIEPCLLSGVFRRNETRTCTKKRYRAYHVPTVRSDFA